MHYIILLTSMGKDLLKVILILLGGLVSIVVIVLLIIGIKALFSAIFSHFSSDARQWRLRVKHMIVAFDDVLVGNPEALERQLQGGDFAFARQVLKAVKKDNPSLKKSEIGEIRKAINSIEAEWKKRKEEEKADKLRLKKEAQAKKAEAYKASLEANRREREKKALAAARGDAVLFGQFANQGRVGFVREMVIKHEGKDSPLLAKAYAMEKALQAQNNLREGELVVLIPQRRKEAAERERLDRYEAEEQAKKERELERLKAQLGRQKGTVGRKSGRRQPESRRLVCRRCGTPLVADHRGTGFMQHGMAPGGEVEIGYYCPQCDVQS